MAYTYQTGTANDLPHWFSLLETFLTAVGGAIAGGGGTTTVVFSSPGELGGRTKLFVRFRRGVAALAPNVYPGVRDDLAGTHTTSETEFLVAPGLGAIPFEYWMAADKDKVIVNFKAGAGYTGFYVGLVEPFALTVDEEEQMVSLCLSEMDTSPNTYVLKKCDGTWDKTSNASGVMHDQIKDPLDNSVALFGCMCKYQNDEIVGQATDVSFRISTVGGLNPEDIITTGYPGATSTWIVMGTGTMRWCVRTGGVVPVGQLEGAHFAHTNGLATSQADFEAKLLAFMTSVGWTLVPNPAPAHPIDYFWYSQGENGVDDIYVHWDYNPAGRYEVSVSDDTALTHECTSVFINVDTPAGWPTYYYITADRDCLFVTIEETGTWTYAWAGMYQLFLPDPASVATPYKVGNQGYMLRDHDGNWAETAFVMPDSHVNSSLNLYDGVTNIIWQYFVRQGNDVPTGVCKYLHRLSGPGLSNMDTVAIGARSFRYFYGPSPFNFAFREV